MKTIFMAAAFAVLVFGATQFSGHLADAKGKPGAQVVPATITLDQSDPHLGGVVSFTTSVPGNVSSPRIEIDCSQNGSYVYTAAGPASDWFVLGGASSAWTANGGAADCVAILYYWDFHPTQTFMQLASVSFHADGR